MTRPLIAFFTTALLLLAGSAAQATDWVAGKHYFVLPQAQRTNVAPGKVEVMEVFSYGCPLQSLPAVHEKLKAALPANAQLAYLPASWSTAENWPTFQRAYLTAQSLGSPRRRTTRCSRPSGPRVSSHHGQQLAPDQKHPAVDQRHCAVLPARDGVKAADFVNASKSFSVDLKMRQADTQVTAMQVPSTPTLVVGGKYRVNNDAFKTDDEIIALVRTGGQGGPPPRRPGGTGRQRRAREES